jgi:hypothetical protein
MLGRMDWWLAWKVVTAVGFVLCGAMVYHVRKGKGNTRGYRVLGGVALSIPLVLGPVCIGLADQP